MKISYDTELGPLTTFGVGGKAHTLIECESISDIRQAIEYSRKENLPFTILGGGSNTLASEKGYNGIVLLIRNKGVEFVSSDSMPDTIHVIAQAGEDWDALVKNTVEKGLWGFENLSAIPGSVGASPIQNIGAYGAEVQSAIVSVECIDTTQNNLPIVSLSNNECNFSYRTSIFKNVPGKYIVTSVTYALSKKALPNISYPDLQKVFGTSVPQNSMEVRKAVCDIRSKKLPSLTIYGTAGSFFKNPILKNEQVQVLIERYPNLPTYQAAPGTTKISLAWLLDNILHMKGYKKGTAEVYSQQPLVIVVNRNATAQVRDVNLLAEEIEKRCFETFGITIEREVCSLLGAHCQG